MTKLILAWSVVLLVLLVFANSVLSIAEGNCQEKCALQGADYQYQPPVRKLRSRGGRGKCDCIEYK